MNKTDRCAGAAWNLLRLTGIDQCRLSLVMFDLQALLLADEDLLVAAEKVGQAIKDIASQEGNDNE